MKNAFIYALNTSKRVFSVYSRHSECKRAQPSGIGGTQQSSSWGRSSYWRGVTVSSIHFRILCACVSDHFQLWGNSKRSASCHRKLPWSAKSRLPCKSFSSGEINSNDGYVYRQLDISLVSVCKYPALQLHSIEAVWWCFIAGVGCSYLVICLVFLWVWSVCPYEVLDALLCVCLLPCWGCGTFR